MFSSHVLAYSLVLFSFVGVALGHGTLVEVNVDGTSYEAWKPWTDPYESPVPDRVVRKITNDGPITDLSSTDVACNKLGQTGQKITAKVAPGGKVKFQWTNWPLDHYGPVTVYMASCNGKCADLDLSKAGSSVKWFKVDAKGYDSAAKRWATQDLIDAGSSWTSTVPSDLAPGEYLMRSEIVALHSLPAQVYPECVQLSVTGSGTAKPSSSQTVAIPGVYDGYTWPYIWSDFTFKLAGPDVFSASGASGGGSSPVSSSSSAAPIESVLPTKIAVVSPSSSSVPAAATSLVSSASPTNTSTSTSAAASATSTRSCKRRRSNVAAVEAPLAKANSYKRHGSSRRSVSRLSPHH